MTLTHDTGPPGLVDLYRQQPRPSYDEMLGRDGLVRPAYRDLATALDTLGAQGLADRSDDAGALLDGDGVVYRTADSTDEQRWALDPLPLLLEDAEWASLEPGLAQRARLLDLLLTDLYGRRSVLRRKLLPPEIIFSHSGFLRSCDQLRVPGPHQLFTTATDLARDGDGRWIVLHDRAQAPSGAGFAMENRRVISRVLPGLYRDARIHRLGPFFHAMRVGLEEVAPSTPEAPRIVVLTSGPQSETAFDQAFLSSLLGYPLAQGSDLSLRDGRVWLRGIDGPEQVDVILRRVDSTWCDPLELRPESQLGIPGLLEACRLGTVSVVNGLGSGVLENPGLLPFLPALARGLLDETLLLPSVHTWWCGDPVSRQHVAAHLEGLVVKPLARGLGRSSIFGWELSGAERAELIARIEVEPHAWVAQEPLPGSTAPTWAAGGVEPRSMVLRTFSVAQGGDYRVLAGGLVRVAPERDSVLVSSQAGAVAKDAWVLTSRPQPMAEPWLLDGAPAEMRPSTVAPRVAEDLFWLGRYAERAEATTRLLRVVRDRSADFTRSAEPAGAQTLSVLLEVLTTVTTTWPGFVGPLAEATRQSPQAELFALAADPTRPGTFAHSVQRLTETIYAVRDQLSPDTWLVLGSLDTSVRELAAAGPRQDVAVGQMLTAGLGGLLALSGLTAESMVRDLGWRFLEIGRRIERAQQITALLSAALLTERPDAVDSLVVESVLVAADSIITYRRRYAPRSGVATVLDLLLADADNPRSVSFQLDELETHLAHVPGSAGLRGDLATLTGLLRSADTAALAGHLVDGVRPELRSFLTDIERRLRGLGRDVERSWFELILAPQPIGPAAADS